MPIEANPEKKGENKSSLRAEHMELLLLLMAYRGHHSRTLDYFPLRHTNAYKAYATLRVKSTEGNCVCVCQITTNHLWIESIALHHNNCWKGFLQTTHMLLCTRYSFQFISIRISTEREIGKTKGTKNYWILIEPKNQVTLNAIRAENKGWKCDLFFASFRCRHLQAIRWKLWEHF